MKTIDMSRPRYDYDGVEHDKQWIENWYLNAVNSSSKKNSIKNRLNRLRHLSAVEKDIRNDLIEDLQSILIGDPLVLDKFRDSYGKRIDALDVSAKPIRKGKGRRPKTFKEKLLAAFGYNNARHNVLIQLANYLNIKTCPYCNLHYTLTIRDIKAQDKQVLMAKMQFDHFFDKATYPFLSMSLYNLIPSCPICNQGKSQSQLSLEFHPYYSNIYELYKFRVKNPLGLFIGDTKDQVELELVKQKGGSMKQFDQVFHITKLYERHRDIAQEEFAKAYLNYYYGYPEFFGFINDDSLRKLLIYGHYNDKEDIVKRPMSKFKQDLWEQAKEEIVFIKLP